MKIFFIAEGRGHMNSKLRHLLSLIFILNFLAFYATFMTKVEGGSSTNVLYAHAETTTIEGVNYCLFKFSSADGPATVLNASAVTAGRKLMERWVYPLSGIESIYASTWTVTYRAMKSASASSVVAHCDVDVLIRKSDGTVRTTIATNVANSPNITLTNAWQTLTGLYDWPGYTVVDQTDYLEVDYYIEVTTPQNSKQVRLLVDDPTLPLSDQTKIENVVFIYPNQPPIASFTYSPTNPLIYETATFDASASHDPDGNIVSYTWDFGDGNITTVTEPIITHIYTIAGSTVNYAVTLTVTDNEGSTSSTSQIVSVTNPSILNISLPAGTYNGPDPDPWLSQCWLLNITEFSVTFTLRVDNIHSSIESYDTHLIIVLNDAAYEYLNILTVNGTTINKDSFTYGTPRPYGFTLTWEEDVYPAWFSTAYGFGTIDPSSYVNLIVDVAFTNITGVKMHFDAFGSIDYPPPPTSKGHVTHNPHNSDSTIIFWQPPVMKYQLTVRTSGLGTYVTNVYNGTTLLGSATDATPYTGLFEEGSLILLNIDSPITDGSKRFVFTQWSGDATGSNRPVSVIMTSAKDITANYKTQYQITVTANPSGALGGTFKVTYTQCGTTYMNVEKTTPWTEWVDTDTTVTTSAPQDIINISPGTRYKFDHCDPSSSVTMDQAKTITLVYRLQYLLTVVTDPTGLTPQPTRNPAGEADPANGWWYDASTSVTLTAQSVTGYNFNYWDVNGVSQGTGANPITVHMNATYTATAHYTQVAPPLTVSISPLSASILTGQSLTFTSTVTGGYTPYTYQWYLNGNPVSGANSNSWTFTPTAAGTYYVQLKVTDANNNVAQSETARVVVSSVPVGGYSISLTKQATTQMLQTTIYTALIILSATVLSLTKRKRK
jgi:PKD repeat protein